MSDRPEEFDLTVVDAGVLKPDPRACGSIADAGMRTLRFDVRDPSAGYAGARTLPGLETTEMETGHDSA